MTFIKEILTKIIQVDSKTASFLAIIIAMSAIFFTYRESKGMEYKDVIKEYKEQLDSYRTALEDCVQASEQLTFENYQYKLDEARKMDYKRTSILPEFSKKVYSESEDPIMFYMNHKYASRYVIPLGKNADDYIGKTDIDFWGFDIGKEFLKLDKLIIKNKIGLDVDVTDPISKKRVRVILDPVLYNNRVIQIDGKVIIPRINYK